MHKEMKGDGKNYFLLSCLRYMKSKYEGILVRLDTDLIKIDNMGYKYVLVLLVDKMHFRKVNMRCNLIPPLSTTMVVASIMEDSWAVHIFSSFLFFTKFHYQ